MTLSEEVKQLQDIGIAKILRDQTLKSRYIRIHKKVFLSNLCVTCNAYIKHSFIQFSQLNQSKIKVMSDRKYIFKKNTVLWFEPHRTHYTNDNITDKIAKEMLKASPVLEKFFESMPEGGKKSAGKTDTKDEGKTLSQMNKTELTVEVKKLEGITEEGVKTMIKETNKEIVKLIKGWTPPSIKEENPEGGDDGKSSDDDSGDDSEDDSPAVVALKQMDEADLQKYAGSHEDKFPDWKKHELKEDLLAYLVKNV